uniref:Uncharacterized protein n=1 Tax=Oryza meridionalis TaxID=40149 RepID=A0A0E0D6M1_9ORYZ
MASSLPQPTKFSAPAVGETSIAQPATQEAPDFWDSEDSFGLHHLFAQAALAHPCLTILAAHRTAVPMAGSSRQKGKSPLAIVGAAVPLRISEPDEVKDIFVCHSSSSDRPVQSARPGPPGFIVGSRSPPPSGGPHVSPRGTVLPRPIKPTGAASSESSEEVESGNISLAATPIPALLNPAFAELLRLYLEHYNAYAPFADMRITAHYASAFLFPAAPDPSRIIWDAMRDYLPGLHFTLNPAGRGAMFLRFSTPEERDTAVEFPGTLEAGGHILVLEKPEENETRFHQPLDQLTELEVTDWPPEHRIPGRIRNLFLGAAFVVEIDDECVYGDDMSALCMVVQLYLGQPVLPAMFVWLRNVLAPLPAPLPQTVPANQQPAPSIQITEIEEEFEDRYSVNDPRETFDLDPGQEFTARKERREKKESHSGDSEASSKRMPCSKRTSLFPVCNRKGAERPALALLQESKLSNVDVAKACAFLPSYLSDYIFIGAYGTRGGLVSAWDGSILNKTAYISRHHSLSITFDYALANLSFTVTNIYAPSDHAFTDDFLLELKDLHSQISGPWLLVGDFNLIRSPSEKNNDNFHASLAAKFNGVLDCLALLELPLLDRLFTWTNKRDSPVLARLDRAFINIEWNNSFPMSNLKSLTRTTSDHVPLIVSASTWVPKPNIFRFENSHLLDPSFLPTALAAWDTVAQPSDGVAALAVKLKKTRSLIKTWVKKKKLSRPLSEDCKFVIDLLDAKEEMGPLSSTELLLRNLVQIKFTSLQLQKAAYWKQRGKVRKIKLGIDNTHFFKAHASHNHRKTYIRSIKVDNMELADHASKALVMFDYYKSILGVSSYSEWRFDLYNLYQPAAWNCQQLVAPFTQTEILLAIRQMDRNSAPSPDGFGPGLPLSPYKVKKCDLHPMISRTEKYLSSWQACLLSYAERLILVNSILDSLPVYAMSAIKLPKGIVEDLDKLQRAFLWSGDDTCSGARCLVAWDSICVPKQYGGLGIKDIGRQNNSLLVKRLHHLYSSDSSWARWIWREHVDSNSADQKMIGPHWKSLVSLLPVLRDLTSVQIGDGQHTSFWHDRWCGDEILADKLRPLYTHSLCKTASVAQVLSGNLRDHFAPRLSTVAEEQILCLNNLLLAHIHGLVQDERRPRSSTGAAGFLKSKQIYLAGCKDLSPCANWKFVWDNKAPLKVQFFAWLLARERLPTKHNLHKKTIVQSPLCDLCSMAIETASHLCIHCPFAADFWGLLNIQINISSTEHLAALLPPPQIPVKHYKVFYLLCFWNLWNHRHDVVFRNEPLSLHRLLVKCIDDATLWAERLRFDDRHVVSAWKDVLSSSLRSMNM